MSRRFGTEVCSAVGHFLCEFFAHYVNASSYLGTYIATRSQCYTLLNNRTTRTYRSNGIKKTHLLVTKSVCTLWSGGRQFFQNHTVTNIASTSNSDSKCMNWHFKFRWKFRFLSIHIRSLFIFVTEKLISRLTLDWKLIIFAM